MAAAADAPDAPPQSAASERKEDLKRALQAVKKYVLDNSLPLFFGIATIIALAAPVVGRALAKPQLAGVRVVSFVLMFLIFFCSGLALKTRELKAAFGRRALAGTTWGLAAICAITPTLGFLVRLIKITPPEYITGLVIMLTAPTTLGVGISMTQRSKGNVGLAIALTVVSNAIGVAVMPLWLETLLAKGTQQQLARPFPLLIAKLAVNNLLPTLLGKLLREVSTKRVAPWADKNKAWLGVFSNFCLAVIILQNISGARDELLKTAVGVFFIVVALAIGYHALFLVVNWLALSALRVPPPEKAASLILASQKSAPVALTAIEFITNDETVQGLLAVPCIIGQLGQVFMGHPLTVWLGKRNARYERREKAAREAEAEKEKADAARVVAEGVEGGVAVDGVEAAAAAAGQVPAAKAS